MPSPLHKAVESILHCHDHERAVAGTASGGPPPYSASDSPAPPSLDDPPPFSPSTELSQNVDKKFGKSDLLAVATTPVDVDPLTRPRTPTYSYKVGKSAFSSPLVQTEHVKEHLGLLREFKVLRTRVRGVIPGVTTVVDVKGLRAHFGLDRRSGKAAKGKEAEKESGEVRDGSGGENDADGGEGGGVSGLQVRGKHLRRYIKNIRRKRRLEKDRKEEAQLRRNVNLPSWLEQREGDFRWRYLVSVAVERFQLWLEAMSEEALKLHANEVQRQPAIPTDVLMVWHAYMLNPSAYAEDCDRLAILKPLTTLYKDVISQLTTSCAPSGYEPSEADKESWIALTGTPFDIFEALHSVKPRWITCPFCSHQFQVSFYDPKGAAGYIDAHALFKCPSCSVNISKDNLATRKFAQDLLKNYKNPKHVERYGKSGVYMAGTLRTPTLALDKAFAERVVDGIKSHPKFASAFAGEDYEESLKKFIRITNGRMSSVDSTLAGDKSIKQVDVSRYQRMLDAYTDDRPFSLDLVSAVLRQCTFIDKMDALEWTLAGKFDQREDEDVLDRAVARYHAFLDLMVVSPGVMLVPTLDIDLVWHTHQLTGKTYGEDCLRLLTRFVDHDDKVGGDTLDTALETTARAWKKRFGVPYTHCGCPQPHETLGDKLSRIARRSIGSSPAPSSPISSPPTSPTTRRFITSITSPKSPISSHSNTDQITNTNMTIHSNMIEPAPRPDALRATHPTFLEPHSGSFNPNPPLSPRSPIRQTAFETQPHHQNTNTKIKTTTTTKRYEWDNGKPDEPTLPLLSSLSDLDLGKSGGKKDGGMHWSLLVPPPLPNALAGMGPGACGTCGGLSGGDGGGGYSASAGAGAVSGCVGAGY